MKVHNKDNDSNSDLSLSEVTEDDELFENYIDDPVIEIEYASIGAKKLEKQIN